MQLKLGQKEKVWKGEYVEEDEEDGIEPIGDEEAENNFEEAENNFEEEEEEFEGELWDEEEEEDEEDDGESELEWEGAQFPSQSNQPLHPQPPPPHHPHHHQQQQHPQHHHQQLQVTMATPPPTRRGPDPSSAARISAGSGRCAASGSCGGRRLVVEAEGAATAWPSTGGPGASGPCGRGS